MKIAATTLIALAALASTNADNDCETIYEIVKEDSRFETLQTALELAGLDDDLDEDGPFTVFAPTENAFDKLDEEDLKALVDNKKALRDVLKYHVVMGETFSDELKDGQGFVPQDSQDRLQTRPRLWLL